MNENGTTQNQEEPAEIDKTVNLPKTLEVKGGTGFADVSGNAVRESNDQPVNFVFNNHQIELPMGFGTLANNHFPIDTGKILDYFQTISVEQQHEISNQLILVEPAVTRLKMAYGEIKNPSNRSNLTNVWKECFSNGLSEDLMSFSQNREMLVSLAQVIGDNNESNGQFFKWANDISQHVDEIKEEINGKTNI